MPQSPLIRFELAVDDPANFYIDDVAATLAKAVTAGGRVAMPPMDIPNVGTAGIFVDPEGIAVGVFHPQGC